ncbi:MAG: EthD domain-containing protein [Solirubrobacteraceae bacterium]
MIRLVHLLRRREGLSSEDFSDYLRDEHGPLVAAQGSRLGILRYTQTHRLTDPHSARTSELRGEMEEPYDAVAESWWESEDQLEEAMRSQATAALLADEEQFIDLPRSPLWLAHEYPQFSLSLTPFVARPNGTLVKAHFVLRHPSELTLAEAQRYWLTVHGPLIRSMSPALGLLAYQQVHRFDSPLERALRDARGTTVDTYMGHAEMWYDRALTRRSPEIEAANVRAAEDEAHFIDFALSASWMGKEHVVVERG